MRFIFSIIFLFVVVFTGNCQLFNAGGKLGMAFDDAAGSNVQYNTIKTGGEIGGFGEYILSNTLSVQMEINYIQKGYRYSRKFSDTSTSVKDNLKYVINYMNIPLLIKFTLGEDNETKYFFNAGPYVNFLWSAKLSGTRVITMTKNDTTFAYPYSYNDKIVKYLTGTSYGMTIGVGMIFPIERFAGNFFFEVRYDRDLTETKFNGNAYLNDNQGSALSMFGSKYYPYNSVFKNSTFILNAGMIFMVY